MRVQIESKTSKKNEPEKELISPHHNVLQTREDIAETFVLHENGRLVAPNLPFYYVRINANKVIDGLFVGNQEAANVRFKQLPK